MDNSKDMLRIQIWTLQNVQIKVREEKNVIKSANDKEGKEGNTDVTKVDYILNFIGHAKYVDELSTQEDRALHRVDAKGEEDEDMDNNEDDKENDDKKNDDDDEDEPLGRIQSLIHFEDLMIVHRYSSIHASVYGTDKSGAKLSPDSVREAVVRGLAHKFDRDFPSNINIEDSIPKVAQTFLFSLADQTIEQAFMEEMNWSREPTLRKAKSIEVKYEDLVDIFEEENSLWTKETLINALHFIITWSIRGLFLLTLAMSIGTWVGDIPKTALMLGLAFMQVFFHRRSLS
mmetsp:Transcript_19467/g.29066  ORF Transcript_19467/g.29066 Transcript_19467/m.29066 type:complete len:288 (+) Transcript_19467:139-1002(+)